MADSGVRYGWEDWSWDDSVFGGTAAYYEQGRPPYAPTLAEALAGHLGLDGHGRLLDVGCGPGTVTRRLAHLFEHVVGLDPDPEMVTEAQRLARNEQITNASWVLQRAETLPGSLGIFRVITFAASFHWMDRARVAAAARRMLDTNGVVVQVDAGSGDPVAASGPGDTFAPVPTAAIDELRRRWLGPDRRAGRAFATPRHQARTPCSKRQGSNPKRSSSCQTAGCSSARLTTWSPRSSRPRTPRRT